MLGFRVEHHIRTFWQLTVSGARQRVPDAFLPRRTTHPARECGSVPQSPVMDAKAVNKSTQPNEHFVQHRECEEASVPYTFRTHRVCFFIVVSQKNAGQPFTLRDCLCWFCPEIAWRREKVPAGRAQTTTQTEQPQQQKRHPQPSPPSLPPAPPPTTPGTPARDCNSASAPLASVEAAAAAEQNSTSGKSDEALVETTGGGSGSSGGHSTGRSSSSSVAEKQTSTPKAVAIEKIARGDDHQQQKHPRGSSVGDDTVVDVEQESGDGASGVTVAVSSEFGADGATVEGGEEETASIRLPRVVVQGVEPPLDVPVARLWEALRHPDHFLYVILRKP